jgi:hypothetical protein
MDQESVAMYARITTYTCKKGYVDDGVSVARGLLPRIKALPGLKEFICTGRMADGKCVTIAIYESKAKAEAAAPQLNELWSRFDHVLASKPEPEGYTVFIHEKPRLSHRTAPTGPGRESLPHYHRKLA